MVNVNVILMEANLNKLLYKIELYLIKIIPVVISGLYLLNTILSYYNKHIELISAIAGISLLPWLFLYISSFVFKFCLYHRLFLYYIAINELIAWYDYKIGFNINNTQYLYSHLVIAGIIIFLVTYLKIKHERCIKEIISEDVARDNREDKRWDL